MSASVGFLIGVALGSRWLAHVSRRAVIDAHRFSPELTGSGFSRESNALTVGVRSRQSGAHAPAQSGAHAPARRHPGAPATCRSKGAPGFSRQSRPPAPAAGARLHARYSAHGRRPKKTGAGATPTRCRACRPGHTCRTSPGTTPAPASPGRERRSGGYASPAAGRRPPVALPPG
jgi:hypothetical protein